MHGNSMLMYFIRYIRYNQVMNTLDELFRFILKHDHVVVFGNLGRHPNVIFDQLVSDPQLNVIVQSYLYNVPSTPDNRIRSNPPNQNESCDLMVIVEPIPNEPLKKPPNAARLVVFTSHLNFSKTLETVWTFVSYFHTPSLQLQAAHTQELLKAQDTSVQVKDMNQVHVDSINTLVIQGQSEQPVSLPNTYVLVDLTRYSHALTMYLAFLDAFDFMLVNKNYIEKWMICFPQQRGRQAFDQFVQYCLDEFHCKDFQNGNVTDKGTILSLLPYYKSGSIDLNFTIPISKVLGVEYISPVTQEDVCKAATKYNLEHWVGNIYRIRN